MHIAFFLVICANAQNPNKLIRQGNNAYTDSSFAAAEESYRTALAADQNAFNAAFNLADAIYKQENYKEASTLFQGLTSKAESKEEKAMAYHNLGNSLLQEGKLEESIESYKNSLRNNPSDKDTKHNLAYAQRMKQEQEQNQEEKKKKNKRKNSKKNKSKKKKNNKKNNKAIIKIKSSNLKKNKSQKKLRILIRFLKRKLKKCLMLYNNRKKNYKKIYKRKKQKE